MKIKHQRLTNAQIWSNRAHTAAMACMPFVFVLAACGGGETADLPAGDHAAVAIEEPGTGRDTGDADGNSEATIAIDDEDVDPATEAETIIEPTT